MTAYGFLFPTLIGLALLAWYSVHMVPYRKSRNWVVARGVLIEFEINCTEKVVRSEKVAYWFPVVKFRYTVDGTEYEGVRASFEKRNVWEHREKRERLGAKWASWKAGETVPVYYDTDHPTAAVLFPYASKAVRSHYLAIATAGVLCVSLGVYLARIGI